ncbi:MAG: urease accessory protein UreF [Tenacibaculum sp.]|nr:urease accessory protein UreF [Tenacibaculum sp.]
MKINALLNLLHVADPNLPIGGYSHSNGLETYVQQGKVNSPETTLTFIKNMLKSSILHNDASYVRLVYEALDNKDFDEVKKIDAECSAQKSPKEIREGSYKLGARLFKIFVEKNEHPMLKELEKYIVDNQEIGNYPIVYAVICYISDIALDEALAGFFFSTASGMVTNAVKLVPLGQLQGQYVLFEVQKEIAAWVEKTINLDKKLIGLASVGFDLRSMQHEKLYSRLYMS